MEEIIKLYTIYRILNMCTSKVYIGVTSESINKRFYRHLYNAKNWRNPESILYKSIRKYGETNFHIFTIEECLNKFDAFKKEIFYIKQYNSKVPNGYNLTDGGEGSPGIKRSQEQFKIHKELYSIPVIREDGIIFPSYTEAAKNSETNTGNIAQVIKGKRSKAGGYKWKLLNNDPIEERVIERVKRELNQERTIYKRKPIYCFTNNKKYSSIMEASRDLNIDFRQIQAVACGKRLHCKGFKFKYI